MKIRALLSRLSRREQGILFLTIALLSMVALDRLVYRPITHRFQDVAQEIRAAEHRLRTNLSYLAARPRILAEHVRYQQYFVTSTSDEEATSRLLRQVEGLARDLGPFLVTMKPRRVVTSDVTKIYAVEVEFKGSVSSLIKFLYGLQGSEHLMSVQQFRMTRDRATSLRRGTLSITETLFL